MKLTESGATFYTDLSECNNILEKEMMDIIGKKRLEEMRASLFEIVNHLEEKRKVNLGS